MATPLVSVIAPVFNEEEVIEEFVERVTAATGELEGRYEFEIILIDDGSTDRTLEILRRLRATASRLSVIELRRNYGQTPALQAGLDAARGEIFITLDADLQHFPEEIPRFIEKLEQGYDMVCGWRRERAEGVLRRWPSRVANSMIRRISGISIHDFGTTFRCYRRELVADIQLLGDSHRFVPVLGSLAGGRICEIPISNIERPAGSSSYGLGRTLGVFLDLLLLYFIVRYLDRPMRAFGQVALLCFSAGFIILGALVAMAYIQNIHAVVEHLGWFLVSVMLLLTAVQVLFSGILAEIMVRVHYGRRERRTYHVRRVWGPEAAGD